MSEREVPKQFGAFACGEYFATDAFRRGVFEVSGQVYLVAPIEQLRIVPEHSFLAVGRPGVDGIEFGYVAGQPGVWALYPSEGRLVPVAQSLAGLVSGWTTGAISVQPPNYAFKPTAEHGLPPSCRASRGGGLTQALEAIQVGFSRCAILVRGSDTHAMQRVAERLGLLGGGATAHKRASDQSKIESYELGIAERHGWGLLLLDSEPLLGDDTTTKLASASGEAELFFWLTQSATAGLWFESHSGGRLRRKWVEVESQVLENIGAPLPQEPPGVFNGDPDEEGERDEFKLMALAEAVTGVTTDELFSMPFETFRRTRL